uniref:Anoctamin n=1 Tax=Saccoglossus kowalevskii TaxID=10224 RepID=A0ABM0LWZ8_SACKO|nr:PREDICTED: anoctamin-8-like [Saccoglossus kowalevskii]
MLFCFELQEYINKAIENDDLPGWMKTLPKILLAVIIGVTEDVYKKVAYWLNDMENYRTEENYENQLIIKLVLGQFVNGFLALFYIAFYLQDMARLRQQLAALLITRQVIGNVKESLLPYALERIKTIRMTYKLAKEHMEKEEAEENVADSDGKDGKVQDVKQSTSSTPVLSQAEVESSMKKYEGTFEDYLEMFIQFGYVILFSSAFPMAGMCALANNVIEIRSDAFKLCWGMQRPFGQRVEDIGKWQDCMELMGVVAVIVNCCLLGVFGHVQRWFPDITIPGIILFVVGMEHLILSMKFAVAYAIPDIPHWVSVEMAKLEFNRRAALKKMEQAMASQSVKDTTKDTAKNGSKEKKEPSPITKTWPTSRFEEPEKSPKAKKTE